MQVTIREQGLAKALKATQVYGEGARAANGPIAAWSSNKPYAFGIETGRHPRGRLARAAGGAFMFKKGIAETATQVPGIMGPAIIKGPAAVGGARRKIQNEGQKNIQKYTPVRSGALRDSIQAVSRPRSA